MPGPEMDKLRAVADHAAIIQTLSRLAQAQDDRDFDAYESCFTETILIHQPMIPGWQPTEMTAAEWTRTGLTRLSGFDVTHHRLFNHVIDFEGEEAVCVVDLHALHLLEVDGEVREWIVGGRYHVRLRRAGGGWLISERELRVRYEQGERILLEIASERGLARAAMTRPE